MVPRGFKGFVTSTWAENQRHSCLLQRTENTMHEQQDRPNANNLGTLTFLCENIVSCLAWGSILRVDLVPVWSACGVCLSCHGSAAVKTLLNSWWLSHRGQVQLCVYDPLCVRVKFYYGCLCLWGEETKTPARMCRWNRCFCWNTAEVNQLKPVVS